MLNKNVTSHRTMIILSDYLKRNFGVFNVKASLLSNRRWSRKGPWSRIRKVSVNLVQQSIKKSFASSFCVPFYINPLTT